MATWWPAALGAHSVQHHNHRLEKIFLSEHAPAVEGKQRSVDKEHLAINRESLHSLLDRSAVETPDTSDKIYSRGAGAALVPPCIRGLVARALQEFQCVRPS